MSGGVFLLIFYFFSRLGCLCVNYACQRVVYWLKMVLFLFSFYKVNSSALKNDNSCPIGTRNMSFNHIMLKIDFIYNTLQKRR